MRREETKDEKTKKQGLAGHATARLPSPVSCLAAHVSRLMSHAQQKKDGEKEERKLLSP